jgi:hypothetical protein
MKSKIPSTLSLRTTTLQALEVKKLNCWVLMTKNQDYFNSVFDEVETPASQSEDNTPLDVEGENKDSLSSLFEDDGTSDYLPEEE